MPKVIAQAFPHGVTSGGLPKSTTEREITDDLPADAIGECVAECIHLAWKAGFDPAVKPFVIIVSFS